MTAALTTPSFVPVAVPYDESVTALPFPGDDPVAVGAAADRLFDAARQLARLDDILFDAATALPDAWRGTAATTGQAELDTIRAALDQGTGRLYRARSALLDLSDELTAARTAVASSRVGWLRAEGEIRALHNLMAVADGSQVMALQEALRRRCSAGMPRRSPGAMPSRGPTRRRRCAEPH